MSAVGTPDSGFAPKKSATGFGVVLALHLLLGWAMVSGLAQRVVDVVKAPLETKLIEEMRQPPPPPPPDLPKPTVQPPQFQQVPVPQVTQAPPPPQQVTPPPAIVPPPNVTPPPAAADAIRVPSPPAPPVQQAPAKVNPDAVYAASFKAYLNSVKRYPTSREARQLKPVGTVRLVVEIDRAGSLVNAAVETTSGSILLDNEALRTARNGRFPPIPSDAFAGQSTVKLVVALEYTLEGG